MHIYKVRKREKKNVDSLTLQITNDDYYVTTYYDIRYFKLFAICGFYYNMTYYTYIKLKDETLCCFHQKYIIIRFRVQKKITCKLLNPRSI